MRAPRLLIVDDEVTQMTALCDTLTPQGYETVGFTSAKAALLALREQRFELLLTDLTMPEMDGIELLRTALEIDPQMVGVVMTGDGTIASAVQAMKVGAFDYILKPFRLSAILPVIARALDVHSLRQENTLLEMQLQEHMAELEARNKELASANNELEAFSASISEDLRAPLRIISEFAQILEADFGAEMPQEAREMLARIHLGTQRMHLLVADLLRLSRLGRQTMVKRRVDLDSLVHALIDELRPHHTRDGMGIHVGPLNPCTADPALLQQVMANLLSNAFKFTRHRDQALVEVGCLPMKEEAAYFVRDNGVGFDMVHANKLFAPFQRLHRAEDYEGTGIGLSIAQRIVERHGGRIWAEAEAGKGATFFFTLAS
ncbi:ATP-binding protein [Acidovorax sp. FJL06]|uniref:sensor histidine kinase n=1 Tax=Acidovorax sp. FJL06 TaxID=2153365 RepID=UPI000F58BCCA|nr:ATP-binding protein [Acidovorax sp. FJL06]RQO83885.1 hybrid sensor histidine kinase/response regulator [Acidovorax sp. FJL06]